MGDLDLLRRRLRELDTVVVAFSGGADSAFLAWMATDTLGPASAACVTAVSPSLAGDELDDCSALAHEWSLRWTTVVTDEFDRPEYVANDGDRCFHCKSALMAALAPMAEADAATIVLGTNIDDLGDHRPGQRAAAEAGAAFPLVDAGFAKADVREASRLLGSAPGTSRRPRACRPGCRTGHPSRWACSTGSVGPRARFGDSGSASSASGTMATWLASSSTSTNCRPRSGDARRLSPPCKGRLSLCHARPGRLPVGQSQRRAAGGARKRAGGSLTNSRVKLTFPEHLIRQPLLGRLVREFDVLPNIRRANVEDTVGWIVCELSGEEGSVESAIGWLEEAGVQVDRLGDVVE